jgi:hypothetical protein
MLDNFLRRSGIPLLSSMNRNNITSFYHHDADNVGDRLCGPANYFFPNIGEKRDLRKQLTVRGKVVFGGGQIFDQVQNFTNGEVGFNSANSFVAWGIGLPLRGKRDSLVREVASRFELFGTRNFEWRDVFDFVPCASCMSPVFDEPPPPTHEFVIYSHRKKTPRLKAWDGVPFMTNINRPAVEVAKFLASGETVVTSSYHGVFWAQLLGRRVVCVPFSDKFRTFQHSPFYSTVETWEKDLSSASKTESPLEEYRFLNNLFYNKVSDLWGLQ